jgi:hypothetical protein
MKRAKYAKVKFGKSMYICGNRWPLLKGYS